MKVVELLKIGAPILKLLSKSESSIHDWKYVGLYEDFMAMKRKRVKVRYIVSELAKRYDIGESTVYKIIRRLAVDC